MSESLDGVSISVTRQNAGSVLNAAVAVALVVFGGANAPACTDTADSSRPFVTLICASDSHAIGAGAAAFTASSVAAVWVIEDANPGGLFRVTPKRAQTAKHSSFAAAWHQRPLTPSLLEMIYC